MLASLALFASVPLACGGDDTSNAGDGGSDASLGDGGGGGGDATSDGGGGGDAANDAPEPTIVVRGGGRFTCASHDGALKCFGWDYAGGLGRGTNDTDPHPTPVQATNMIAVGGVFALGFQHTCAVNGSVLSCWGNNEFDQLGHDNALDLDAGDGGSAEICNAAQCRTVPTAVNGITAVAHLSLGDSHSCALTTAGVVSCWGDNSNGQLGWDSGGPTPTPTPVGTLTNVTEIAIGFFSSCALRQDGSVWCWGGNQHGTLGSDTTDAGADAAGVDYGYHVAPIAVPGVSGATNLAVGVEHACAVVAGGAVMCWGSNGNGQLGHASILDPSCSGGESCRTIAQPVPGLAGVTELALGIEHSCALKSDGTVWCWGYNGTGELGRGDASVGLNDPTPKMVAGLADVAHVAAGYGHTCAVTHGDAVYCWGQNSYGQLGSNPGDGGPNGSPLYQTSHATRVTGL